MRVLVTGATGFTGFALCKALVERGDQVVAFVRSLKNAEKLQQLGVECKVVDIKDAADVNKHFEKFYRVYHIAAAYRGEQVDRDEFRLVNVEAARNILDAAVANGVDRYVHCSTVGVQGEIADPPADEDYRFSPHDHYQESKLEGELLARSYFDRGLIKGSVVRPTGLYGPGDMRFLKLFRGINRGYFFMIGSGKTLYHLTYIDDMVQGILLAGEKEAAIGEVFTIGSTSYTTIREMVDTVADILGKPHPKLRIPIFPMYIAAVLCDKVCRLFGVSPPLYPRRLDFFRVNRAFTIEKAQRLLGFHPQTELKQGLTKTSEWYKEHNLL